MLSLEENPDAKLNVARIVVSEQSSEVCIVGLTQTIKLQTLQSSNVKRIRGPGCEPFRHRHAEEIQRQCASSLTWKNWSPIGGEQCVDLGQCCCLTRIRSQPRIQVILNQIHFAG